MDRKMLTGIFFATALVLLDFGALAQASGE